MMRLLQKILLKSKVRELIWVFLSFCRVETRTVPKEKRKAEKEKSSQRKSIKKQLFLEIHKYYKFYFANPAEFPEICNISEMHWVSSRLSKIFLKPWFISNYTYFTQPKTLLKNSIFEINPTFIVTHSSPIKSKPTQFDQPKSSW